MQATAGTPSTGLRAGCLRAEAWLSQGEAASTDKDPAINAWRCTDSRLVFKDGSGTIAEVY